MLTRSRLSALWIGPPSVPCCDLPLHGCGQAGVRRAAKSRLSAASFGARRGGTLREKRVGNCWTVADLVQVIKTRFFVILELATIVLPDLRYFKLSEPGSTPGNRHNVEWHPHSKQRSRAIHVIHWGVGITRPCIGCYDLLSAGAQAYSQR